MKIMGIDPSLSATGIVLFSGSKKYRLSDYCVILTKPSWDYGTRYRHILKEFNQFFERTSPDFIVLEDVDFRPIVTRQAQAYVFGSLAVILASIPETVGYYLVKKYVVNQKLGFIERGKKRTAKQVKERVKRAYSNILKKVNMPHDLQEHLADAIALVDYYLREIGNGSIEG